MAGSALGDTLAAISGHDVNRQGLNAFVDSSQTQNALRAQQTGLVSQQTQEAMLNAQRMQEEADARARLPGALQQMLGPNAHASDGQMMADLMINKYGSAKDVFDMYNRATLSNPALLGTGAQTAAQQGIEGKVATPFGVQPDYATLPGAFQPNVQQTPQGAAQTADTESQTRLRNAQAAAGGFNPNHASSANRLLEPDELNHVITYIHNNPNAAPSGRALYTPQGMQIANALGIPIPSLPGGPVPVTPPGSPSGSPPGAPTPITGGPNGFVPGPGVSYKDVADIHHAFSVGPESKQLTALNTMGLHSQLFDQIADELGNGNIVPTNAIAQKWAQTFNGSAVPGNLKIAADFLGREAVRATVNAGAGTGKERELDVGEDSPPAALHGAADTLRRLAFGQLTGLDAKARRGGYDIAPQLPFWQQELAASRTPTPVAAPPPQSVGDTGWSVIAH